MANEHRPHVLVGRRSELLARPGRCGPARPLRGLGGCAPQGLVSGSYQRLRAVCAASVFEPESWHDTAAGDAFKPLQPPPTVQHSCTDSSPAGTNHFTARASGQRQQPGRPPKVHLAVDTGSTRSEAGLELCGHAALSRRASSPSGCSALGKRLGDRKAQHSTNASANSIAATATGDAFLLQLEPCADAGHKGKHTTYFAPFATAGASLDWWFWLPAVCRFGCSRDGVEDPAG
mmetsp:Transcript_25193/g.59194  ORF Transcript_25193/g.59194 Transcript_25193/m.59194 type:complete len:233 (-) Transcript_25193:575-1273(-)